MGKKSTIVKFKKIERFAATEKKDYRQEKRNVKETFDQSKPIKTFATDRRDTRANRVVRNSREKKKSKESRIESETRIL